jgi:hypothetical protein
VRDELADTPSERAFVRRTFPVRFLHRWSPFPGALAKIIPLLPLNRFCGLEGCRQRLLVKFA